MGRRPGRLTRALTRAFVAWEAKRFRRSGGTRPAFGKHPQLLLTTVGRKTGKPRTVPLLYGRDDQDRLIVVASYAGADQHPAWWLNLRDAGKGRVEVGSENYEVAPVELEGEERERAWKLMLDISPRYADYAKKTTRRIPVVALTRLESAEGVPAGSTEQDHADAPERTDSPERADSSEPATPSDH